MTVTRLPPLNALRAFEAAGRHLSFTKAARELNVTQAAISHQIKGLEAYLGLALFIRQNRGLALTPAGQTYLPAITRAFERLVAATAQLDSDVSTGILTVSVLPSFGARWLVPRLARFRQIHPDIDVRLIATDIHAHFEMENADIAIRWGGGQYEGVRVDPLLTEEIFPVCSPHLAHGPVPLRTVQDLRYHTLLHDDLSVTWSMWLEAAGVEDVDASRGPAFDDSSMLLQAAAAGQGVALGRGALALDDLQVGRLVRPFDVSLPGPAAYYLVYPEHAVRRPKIVAFRTWILGEVSRDADAGHAVQIPLAADVSRPEQD